MRVLMVTNMFPSEQFPALGTFFKDQVDALRGKGIEVDVLPITGRRKDKKKYVTGIGRFLAKMRSDRYDLVHAHHVFCGTIDRLQTRHPILVSYHGMPEMVGWVGALSRALAIRVDKVTVTSRREKARLGRDDAFILPCGVDFELFRPEPTLQTRDQLGLPRDKKLVLFAAETRPEKRYDIAKAAVEIIGSEDRDVELVTLMGQPHYVVPRYMNACDVLVLTSDMEGSPVAIKEAMACNLPIVSVDVGDVKEVIGKTSGCYMCEQDPQDVAQKLKMVLREGRRTGGRADVAHLELSALADKLIAIYEETIRSRARK